MHRIYNMVYGKTETVNYRLLIDLVLEQIINLSVEKDIFTMKSLILAQDER